MLTNRADTISDTEANNYHNVNLFMTKTVTPVCISDNSVADSNGKTCADLYDFDSSTCGQFDTDTFISIRDCCGCQGSNGAQSVNFLQP